MTENCRFILPPNMWWRWAAMLAVIALLSSLLLSGVSIWFLSSVAIAGLSSAAFTFNFHLPAALIRFFALGRTAAKYGERLIGHRAALLDQSRRRAQLFRAMAEAPTVRAASWQLSDASRLADYLDDVEDIDFAGLRADLPLKTIGVIFVMLSAATSIIAPLSIGPILGLAAMHALQCKKLALRTTSALENARACQRSAALGLGAALASVIPLQGEGKWAAMVAEGIDQIKRSHRHILALERGQTSVDALASLFGVSAAAIVIVAAWYAGLRFTALLVPAFLAFAWFAFGETLFGNSRIVVARMRRRAAQRELNMRLVKPHVNLEVTGLSALSHVIELQLCGLQRRTPNGRAIGNPLNAHLTIGRPHVLTGPSGCGKTSLLKQIAGWLGEDALMAGAFPVSAEQRRALSYFCPHDAAVISDTIRANLFARRADDQELQNALTAVELTDRVRLAGGIDGWITQKQLSLGEAQRLNLARAWLSNRPVILLDEPVEHLDEDQGQRILTRLLDRLSDRIVVLSNHGHVRVKNAVPLNL